MTTYIYIPILTAEMASIANKWNTDRSKVGHAPYPILSVGDTGVSKALRRKFGSGRLDGVAATDTIWLLSHGIATRTSGGALVIGNMRGGRYQQTMSGIPEPVGGENKLYQVGQLARAIEKEGLTKDFVDLRLYCCGAGLDATNGGRAVQPFAQRLKASLTGRGYAAVIVTGFLGDLVAGYSEFYAPGTMSLYRTKPAGLGLGVKVTGETYAQNALNHQRQF